MEIRNQAARMLHRVFADVIVMVTGILCTMPHPTQAIQLEGAAALVFRVINIQQNLEVIFKKLKF